MRRMVKTMATLLVMTCAMTTVPQPAEAGSLFAILIELTSGDPVFQRTNPAALSLKNSSGRDVRFRIWSDLGEYQKIKVAAQETNYLGIYSEAGYFAVEAAVWNASRQKYVVKDYAEFHRGSSVEFYKFSRREMFLIAW